MNTRKRKQKKKLFWIDDYPNREASAISLAGRLNMSPDFYHFTKMDDTRLTDMVENCKEASLVIIDQDLLTKNSALFPKGSLLATIVRPSIPTVPIVLLTADRKEKKITDDIYQHVDGLILDSQQNEDWLINRLQSLIRGYEELNKSFPTQPKINGIDALLELLNAPESTHIRIGAIVQEILPGPSLGDDGAALFRVAKWIRGTLIERPGMLCDELRVSTFLGLNGMGFEKVEKHFKSCIYDGIFANGEERRWWVDSVSAKLYELTSPERAESSLTLGRKLKNINDEDQSECFECNGKVAGPPETVAFTDDKRDEERAIHLVCSEIDKDYSKSLYFDDHRMAGG